jgi:hypothetical protein
MSKFPDEPEQTFLFTITEKERPKERKYNGVGVMEDKELKIENVKDPHTLGLGFVIRDNRQVVAPPDMSG